MTSLPRPRFATRAVQGHADRLSDHGAVMPPIYQATSYAHESIGGQQAYSYARLGCPTRTELECLIADLENGQYGLAFASGMAAIDAVMRATLRPGDEVVVSCDLYGGTRRLLKQLLAPMGIAIRFVDLGTTHHAQGAISDQTRLLWLETPTNPLLNIVDIAALSAVAKQRGVLTAVDNTFASPCLQTPLELGADIVVHSATKYLGGHSDVLSGLVVVNDDGLFKKIRLVQTAAGAVPGPQDCYLLMRGIKTLALRMERHCDNAEKVAAYLSQHEAIEKVFYPGLPTHPGHELAKRQMRRFGGVVSLYLKDDSRDAANRFACGLKLFILAESLGGVESLINHSATMSHGSLSVEERRQQGIRESLLRLSVGIEDCDDLLADLEQALAC